MTKAVRAEPPGVPQRQQLPLCSAVTPFLPPPTTGMEQLERDPRSEDDEADYEEEEVDPRIQGELEKLNQSTDDINRCETALEDARQKFRSVLLEATGKLDELLKKISKAVDESKPYWEARRLARQAQLEAQAATQDFQRATEVLKAAKETISLAEQRLLEEEHRHFDSAWQEMLNHATQRVMEAEHIKTKSELVHKETAAKYTAAMERMKQLEKKLRRTINKSKPYFEMKAKFYLQLENLKKTVDERQVLLSQAKVQYKTALKNLEKISDEIHQRRRSSVFGPRGCGVGSEDESVQGAELQHDSSNKLEEEEEDAISMVSDCFEDDVPSGGGGNLQLMSEEEECHSPCSRGSSLSSPQGEPLSPCPFSSFSSCSSFSSSPPPLCRPSSLDLPMSVSLSDLGLLSPVLGPRSQCSGASSPDSDLERGERAEGAEGLDTSSSSSSSTSTSSSTKQTFRLEAPFSFLNLRRPRPNARSSDSVSQLAEAGQAVLLVQ